MQRNMPKKREALEPLESDSAHFPPILAVLASILALWVSFWGPARVPTLKLQNEWRVKYQFETPSFALPLNDSLMIVAAQSTLRLLKADYSGPSVGFRQGSKAVTEELSRTTLLGRTRVAKGRTARMGCTCNDGAMIITESGVALAVQVANQQNLSKIWETSLTDGAYVEWVGFWEYPRTIDGSATVSSGAYLILYITKDGEPSRTRTLSALDSQSGKPLWDMPIGRTKSTYLDPRLQPYPVTVNDIGIERIRDMPGLSVFRWKDGAMLLDDLPSPPIVVATHFFDRRKDKSESVRVDLDGDGIPEDLQFGFGPDHCIQVRARWTTVLYSNCTSHEGITFPNDVLSQDLLHAIALRREMSHSGATALLGNVSIHRSAQRGFSLVILHRTAGILINLDAAGKVLWKARVTSTEKADIVISQRLRVASLIQHPNGEYSVLTQSHGSEIGSHLIVFGSDDVTIFRASDGVMVSGFNYLSPIAGEPVIFGGRVVVTLANGDVVSLSLRAAKDLIPPLVLIPAMLILSAFWACVMWRRLDDE